MLEIANHQSNRLSNAKSIIKLLGFLMIITVVNVALALQPAQAVQNPTPYEQRLISQTNQERLAQGLPELTYNSQLQQAAIAKAYDMLSQDYFEHITPTGKTPWEFIKEADYNYLKAGENLAIDFADINQVVPAWLASPSHEANIVKSDYKEIGLAVLTGEFAGHETTVIVQLFGTRPGSIFSSR